MLKDSAFSSYTSLIIKSLNSEVIISGSIITNMMNKINLLWKTLWKFKWTIFCITNIHKYSGLHKNTPSLQEYINIPLIYLHNPFIIIESSVLFLEEMEIHFLMIGSKININYFIRDCKIVFFYYSIDIFNEILLKELSFISRGYLDLLKFSS